MRVTDFYLDARIQGKIGGSHHKGLKAPTYRQEGFLGFSLRSATKAFVRLVRFVVFNL